MRRALAIVCLALAILPSAGNAEEPYLFDLPEQPAYRAAWNAMFKGEGRIDAWIVAFGKTYDGVAGPSTIVAVEGMSDRLEWVCKPHDCAGNQLYVLFSSDNTKAWGLLADGKTPK